MNTSQGACESRAPWLQALAKPGLSGLAMKCSRASASACRCTTTRVSSLEALSTTRISLMPSAARSRARHASMVLLL